jgi:hypothetical protein
MAMLLDEEGDPGEHVVREASWPADAHHVSDR